jgi:hypothetical protein
VVAVAVRFAINLVVPPEEMFTVLSADHLQ